MWTHPRFAKKKIDSYPISHHYTITEGYGVRADKNTVYINASSVTYKYSPLNKPIVFDVSKK